MSVEQTISQIICDDIKQYINTSHESLTCTLGTFTGEFAYHDNAVYNTVTIECKNKIVKLMVYTIDEEGNNDNTIVHNRIVITSAECKSIVRRMPVVMIDGVLTQNYMPNIVKFIDTFMESAAKNTAIVAYLESKINYDKVTHVANDDIYTTTYIHNSMLIVCSFGSSYTYTCNNTFTLKYESESSFVTHDNIEIFVDLLQDIYPECSKHIVGSRTKAAESY